MWMRVLNYSIYLILFWSLANFFGIEIKINWEIVSLIFGTLAYVAMPFYIIKRLGEDGESFAIRLVNFLFGNQCFA